MQSTLEKIISDTEFIEAGTFKVRIPDIPSWSSFTHQFLCVDINEFPRNKILL